MSNPKGDPANQLDLNPNATESKQDKLSGNATIVAPATAPGRGGIGVVRISGPKSFDIALKMIRLNNEKLEPRKAYFTSFVDKYDQTIDEGLCLYFPAPKSFTGEDVIELQGHGGPVVLNQIVRTATQYGARLAKPGEFSERAFLNGKIDLAQAEAIADLIASSSEQAAKSAMNSLQGVFSARVNALVEQLTQLRIYVEAAIDFPEEEIDFLSDTRLKTQLDALVKAFALLQQQAKQGVLLQEGMTLVLIGRPNAGKSSLLNALAGEDHAIVTDIPGTTRDLLKAHIHIDGMPINIVDTAGLRNSDDVVEAEGIKRAVAAIASADQLLWVCDVTQAQEDLADLCNTQGLDLAPLKALAEAGKLTMVKNKTDCLDNKEQGHDVSLSESPVIHTLGVSAKYGEGIDELRQHLRQLMGLESTHESTFSARRRHLEALRQAFDFVLQGQHQLSVAGAGELLAEDLRMAQQQLGEITGEFRSDDLLGRIFSSFCIGK